MKLLISNFENDLRDLASAATEIKVMIAFLTEGGLTWLPQEKFPLSDFIVGVDLGITSPGALRTLQDGGAALRVFHDHGRLFHPKAIYIKSATDEHLVIGSNNLTSAGISSNYELGTLTKRGEHSDEVFADFLAYFESLKQHQGCFVPGDPFYEDYRPSRIGADLSSQLSAVRFTPPAPEERKEPTIDPSRASTLGRYLRLLAEEFPMRDRRTGQKKKNHPLVQLNDEEFRPFFKDVISRASQGRLQGHAQINLGGNWYRIPNLLAADESREPGSNGRNRGRACLQIHFSEDYRKIFFSVVLHYYLPKANRSGERPERVERRFTQLLEHLSSFSSSAAVDLPVFLHWEYGQDYLWSKPLISFVHEVESLPSDETLQAELTLLASALNGAMAIG